VGEVLDGKALARRVEAQVIARVAALGAQGVAPSLHVILVGEVHASDIYVRHKQRACARVSIGSHVHRLPASVTQAVLCGLIAELNSDPQVHGILVQLPLPDHIQAHIVLNSVDHLKDVDGFHYINAGHLATDRNGLAPCTPKGVMRMLTEHGVTTRGSHAVVVGRSRVVGRPMAAMLLAEDATVTIVHRHTAGPARYTSQGDIVVVAVGRPGLITPHWVKHGAVVIDVGINRTEHGLCGDVQFDAVLDKAKLVSPVPGGVGPMTIAMLLENTCEAAERQLTRRRDDL
jgi:methylenetetrahydrofolate dehydrogenase (NADP+)/methenyltetrahydrofolate cyclohydrolase